MGDITCHTHTQMRSPPPCHRSKCSFSRGNQLVPPELLTNKSRAQGALLWTDVSIRQRLTRHKQAQTSQLTGIRKKKRLKIKKSVHVCILRELRFCTVTQKKSLLPNVHSKQLFYCQHPMFSLNLPWSRALVSTINVKCSKSIPVSFHKNHIFFVCIGRRDL